jgi:DNA-binding protein HU-beta
MNKADLADRIAASARISKAQATAIIDTLVGGVSSALKIGRACDVGRLWDVHNFLSQSQEWTQPSHGDLIKIPARRAARFSPSSELKKVVNRK